MQPADSKEFAGCLCISYICRRYETLETYGADAGIVSGAGPGREGAGERYDCAYRDVQRGSVQ